MGNFIGKNAIINPRVINVDRSYQRQPKMNRVKYIAEHFDDLLFQRPVVSKRSDGRYFCVTGQHRLLAAALAEKPRVPIILVEGMSREDEAHYFRQDAETTVRVPINSRFAAAIVENDPEYVKIETALNEYGYSAIGAMGHIKWDAVSPLLKLNRLGTLDEGLRLIHLAWGHLPKTRTRDGKLLRGTGEFASRWAGRYDDRVFVDALSHFDPDDFIRLASVNQPKAHPGGAYWVCEEIVRQYNTKAPRGKALKEEVVS